MACNHKEHFDCSDNVKLLTVMNSLQDTIETLERIYATDLTFSGGSVMKLDAGECLQRVRVKLYKIGITPGSNRID